MGFFRENVFSVQNSDADNGVFVWENPDSRSNPPTQTYTGLAVGGNGICWEEPRDLLGQSGYSQSAIRLDDIVVGAELFLLV